MLIEYRNCQTKSIKHITQPHKIVKLTEEFLRVPENPPSFNTAQGLTQPLLYIEIIIIKYAWFSATKLITDSYQGCYVNDYAVSSFGARF